MSAVEDVRAWYFDAIKLAADELPGEDWDDAGLLAVAAAAWERGLNGGVGYAPFMGKPGFPEPENPFVREPSSSGPVAS